MSKETANLGSHLKVAQNDSLMDYNKDFEKKTMRLVDWRVIPVLSLVYTFAMIDRSNMGSAYTAGMGIHLHLLKGNRYSLANCLYFVPYIFLQFPGNLVLRRFGVRNFLTFTVVAWGSIQLAMGFVDSWGSLALCRVLLGIFEVPFLPSPLFILATWYKRHELLTRLAVFYLISTTTGGFSPILAYVFSLLDGYQGIDGWRWIFIIEGAITLFLAIVTWFFIPTFPDQNTFLDARQTELVLRRIDEDRGDAIPDLLTFKKVKTHLSNWKLWANGTIFMCNALPSYAQSYFLPIILKGMGWSQTTSLLLSSPPYGPSIIVTIIVAYLSDKRKHRSGFIVMGVLVCLFGLFLTAFAERPEVRYFGIFLINVGNTSATPTSLAFASNNVVTHSKRAVQTAMTVGFGGLGGVIAATVFRSQDSPNYIPGLVVTMISQIMVLLLVAILTLHFLWLNKQMREGKLKEPLECHPGFFYTL